MIKEQVVAHKQPGDVVVLSIHWGSNWGFTYEGGPGGDQVRRGPENFHGISSDIQLDPPPT